MDETATKDSALASMTGFARSEGRAETMSWAWEIRSVNGRGLDVRLRLPPGFDALEPKLREQAGCVLRRGNVQATLTVTQDERARLMADPAALEDVLQLALSVAARIPGAPAPRAEALLALPGVLRSAPAGQIGAGPVQQEAVVRGFKHAVEELVASRRAEGARLAALLTRQIDTVAALRLDAVAEAADQPAQQRARMIESVAFVLQSQPGLPEERIAQEVALLASRSDVREELDRLTSHIEAARALLAEGAGIGRKFDFLVQELVRETNTLCSKSVSLALTATGLRLKAVIEQVREQVQNIE